MPKTYESGAEVADAIRNHAHWYDSIVHRSEHGATPTPSEQHAFGLSLHELYEQARPFLMGDRQLALTSNEPRATAAPACRHERSQDGKTCTKCGKAMRAARGAGGAA